MMTEIMRKDLEKRIDQWIAGKKSTLIEEVCELVRIKSVADKENEVKPFGQGCRDVVDRFIEICHRHGLETQNHSYYVAEAFDPDIERKQGRIGLMGHLDIVPEGEGWLYPPYEGIVKGGWIIGRGAQDNKGPCLAGLYTLLCLRDLGMGGIVYGLLFYKKTPKILPRTATVHSDFPRLGVHGFEKR